MTTAKRVKDAKIEKKFETARNNKEKTPSFQRAGTTAARFAGARALICASSGYAACVSAGSRYAARFPESRSRPGRRRLIASHASDE
jgi:hypothetical protein